MPRNRDLTLAMTRRVVCTVTVCLDITMFTMRRITRRHTEFEAGNYRRL